MILLDMIGYKNLELGRDTLSTKWLQDVIWQTARELGHQKIFVEREEGVGGDDHEPFVQAGIPSVDLIQLTSYPHWHKADDTIDKISARSMKIVGDTVLASLPKIVDKIEPQKAPQKGGKGTESEKSTKGTN
jgi:Zn-dependent M28 family amino/carboxypeptidase